MCSISSRWRMRLRASAITRRNMRTAGASGGKGKPVELFAVVPKQARLGNLAPDHIPRGGEERLLAQRHDAGGRGKTVQEREEPFGAVAAPEAVDLGEVQGQVVGQNAMEHLGLGL